MNEQTRPDPANNGRSVALPATHPNGDTSAGPWGHTPEVPQSISAGREGVPMTSTADRRGTSGTAPEYTRTAVPSTDLGVPQCTTGRTTVVVPQPGTATRTAGTATQVKPKYRDRLRVWGRRRDDGRTADVPQELDLNSPAGRAALTARIMHSPRRMMNIFYAMVLTIALVGQVQSAAHWMDVWIPFVVLGVLSIEVGGAALLSYVDARRQLKERALPALFTSTGIAGFAISVNWFGHLNDKGLPTINAYFFAGMSLFGYLVFLFQMGARRRDRLRITGDLAEAPPSYEIALWLQHPVITSRARAMAKRDAELGKFGSWDAAKKAIQDEKRDARLARELELLLVENAVSTRLAKIAVAIYEPEEIVSRLIADADYDGLAAILSGKLSASKVLGEDAGRRTAKKPPVPPRPPEVPDSDTTEVEVRTAKPVPQSGTGEPRGTAKAGTADTAKRGTAGTEKTAEASTAKGDDEVYLAAVREEHPTGLVSRAEVVAVLRKHFPDLGPSQSRPGRVRDKLNAERGFHEEAAG